VTGRAVGSVTRLLAAFFLLQASTGLIAAEEFQTTQISVVHVEWRAALDQMRAELGTVPALGPDFAFVSQHRVAATDPRSMPALVQLNAVTSPIFTGIARSRVPVLLPFDTAAYIEAQRSGAPAASLSLYQAEFRPVDLFDAGPAG
jgi:hypothetical protein